MQRGHVEYPEVTSPTPVASESESSHISFRAYKTGTRKAVLAGTSGKLQGLLMGGKSSILRVLPNRSVHPSPMGILDKNVKNADLNHDAGMMFNSLPDAAVSMA